MKPKTIVFVAAGVLFLIILLQNTQVVTLRFLFWEFGMSQIILIPLAVLLGVGVGYILGRKIY